MNIKEKMSRLVLMKGRINQEILDLQSNCPHEDQVGKYGSNTGNYDPHADCYWISVACEDCGRTWSVYNDEPGYRAFKGRIVK